MPFVSTNGIRLAYQRSGCGEPVLLIMGQAAGGNVWTLHQVPALSEAGYEAITFDNRGIPPSDVPPGGYTVADLVADTAGLIEALDTGPCRVVGTSLGAFVAAGLAVKRPDLVTSCVLMARERAATRSARRCPQGIGHWRVAALNCQPLTMQRCGCFGCTLNDDAAISTWLDLYELTGARRVAASGQVAECIPDCDYIEIGSCGHLGYLEPGSFTGDNL